MSIFKSDYIVKYIYPNRRHERPNIFQKCSGPCQEIKHANDFPANKNSPNGIDPRCYICTSSSRIFKALEEGKAVKSTSLMCVLKGFKHCTSHKNQNESVLPMNQFLKVHNFYTCQSGICLECNRRENQEWRDGWGEERKKRTLEEMKEYNRKRRKENPEVTRGYVRKYRIKNREKMNARARERMRNDPQYRIDRLMKDGISGDLKKRGLKKSGRKWLTMVSYDKRELLEHLESTLTPDMKLEEFYSGELHVGHFPWPRELFKYVTPDDIEFQICWGLDNLKLQWGTENCGLMDKLPDGRFARNLTEEERMAIVQPLIDQYKADKEELLLAARAY